MSDMYLEALQNYLHGSEWRQSIEMFVNSNCKYFHNITEMDHQQHSLWKTFQEIVETILEMALMNIGGSIEQLESALDSVINQPSRGPKDDMVKEVLESLLVFSDFQEFAKMMKRASDNQEQAVGDKAIADSLLRMGFPVVAIEEALEQAPPNSSLEDYVTLLSGFLSNGKFASTSADNKAEAEHEAALVIDPTASVDDLANPEKGINRALFKFVDEAEAESLKLDINELNAKFVIADSVLEAFDRSVRSELPVSETAILSLIRWAEDMKMLYHDIVTAYNERIPCKSMCFNCNDGLIRWFLDLEEVRKQIDDGSAAGNMVSDNEMHRMAEMDRIAAMGTADEQLLHSLINRHEEVSKDIQKNHRQVAVLVASDRGVRRENLEELYLYLKQQVASGMELDDLTDELHDQVYSVVSSAIGAEVVNLLLDMHMLEDEEGFLRTQINSIVGSEASDGSQQDSLGAKGSPGRSPNGGFKELFGNTGDGLLSSMMSVDEIALQGAPQSTQIGMIGAAATAATTAAALAGTSGGPQQRSGDKQGFQGFTGDEFDVVTGAIHSSSSAMDMNAEGKDAMGENAGGGVGGRRVIHSTIGGDFKGDPDSNDTAGNNNSNSSSSSDPTASNAGAKSDDALHNRQNDNYDGKSNDEDNNNNPNNNTKALTSDQLEQLENTRRKAQGDAYIESLKNQHKGALRALKGFLQDERARRLKSLEEKLMRRRAMQKQAAASTDSKGSNDDAGGSVSGDAILAEHTAAVNEVEVEIQQTNQTYDGMIESMISGLKKKCLGELAAVRKNLKEGGAAAAALLQPVHTTGSSSQGRSSSTNTNDDSHAPSGSSSASSSSSEPAAAALKGLSDEQKDEAHRAAAEALKERYNRDHLQLLQSLEAERCRQRDKIIKALAAKRAAKKEDQSADSTAPFSSSEQAEMDLEIAKMNKEFDRQEAAAIAGAQERALLGLAAVHLDHDTLLQMETQQNPAAGGGGGDAKSAYDDDDDIDHDHDDDEDGHGDGMGGGGAARRYRRARKKCREWLEGVHGLKESYLNSAAELQQRLRLSAAAASGSNSSSGMADSSSSDSKGDPSSSSNSGTGAAGAVPIGAVGAEETAAAYSDAATRMIQVVTKAFEKQLQEDGFHGTANKARIQRVSGSGKYNNGLNGGGSSSSSDNAFNAKVKSSIISEFHRAKQEIDSQLQDAKFSSKAKLLARRDAARRRQAAVCEDDGKSHVDGKDDATGTSDSEAFALLEQDELMGAVLDDFVEEAPIPTADQAYNIPALASAATTATTAIAAADRKGDGNEDGDAGGEAVRAEQIRDSHLTQERKLLDELHANMLEKKKNLENRLQRRRDDESRRPHNSFEGYIPMEREAQNLESGFDKVAALVKSMDKEDITELDMEQLMRLLEKAARGEEVELPTSQSGPKIRNATLKRPPLASVASTSAADDQRTTFTITKEPSPRSEQEQQQSLSTEADEKSSDIASNNNHNLGAAAAVHPYPSSIPLSARSTGSSSVMDAEVMADEVKRISTQYSEEQQKLDLMMKIQQARQRQSLQRKLFEKSQAKQQRGGGVGFVSRGGAGGAGLGRAAGYGLNNAPTNTGMGLGSLPQPDGSAAPKEDSIAIGPARFQTAEIYRRKSQHAMQPAFKGLPAEFYGAKSEQQQQQQSGSPPKDQTQRNFAMRGLDLHHMMQQQHK